MSSHPLFRPHGQQLIAGAWVGTDTHFDNAPVSGPSFAFTNATKDLVNQACTQAEEAFWSYGYASRQTRAAFLNAIADEIEARADQITEIGTAETGLPEARLVGERGRTTGQLRMFAAHIQRDDFLDYRHDPDLPDRLPLRRPDMKMVQRPIGPVAVFGASNFPLAFSTAGGDTAAALAAGCPVVVRGHPAHPGTGEIIAEAIKAAIERCDIHPGVFSLIQGGGHDIGAAIVQHPVITAVGFTGSLGGGRALFDLCAARATPIPFFGELGSVNPVFLLPNAMAVRGEEIAVGWAGSLTMGAGQFCTNPGIAIVIEGEDADRFEARAAEALSDMAAQTMLTDGIAETYRRGAARLADHEQLRAVVTTHCDGRMATPQVYATTAETWLNDPTLGEEVFGPLGLIIRARDTDEMLALARALEGQLTCTLQMDDGDIALGQSLMPILERKAGRLLANGFPTGVEVADSMVHGGPYPASTNFGATSVGTLAIRRFLRPVCYQDIPADLLPTDLPKNL